ncbi:MAG: cysteine--tRNA ligase [Cytophagales bacterium]|nr:cysteine--tRNA ligase [Cytophagales bacterium]
MQQDLRVYNTKTRKKEVFNPITEGKVGMYVCGPTVYGDAHLGHARPAITFDILYRYFKYLKFDVCYVRNITDVGHLVGDADEGEDKIAKKAREEKIDPFEIAKQYTERYHRDIYALNVLPPDVEPRATQHIQEQIEATQQMIDNGFAYEVNGSVYFDLEKYNEKYNYGELSGRILDEMQNNTRELDGQSDKKNPLDFALWKFAEPEHLMKWDSPWGIGYPGWHLECTAMSTKYLGKHFDIHGGGLDLMFPHHECEIAQGNACNHEEPANYWMHNNMITINGQKMGKSLGNFITLEEIYNGDHKLLENKYSPMTVRFFILQAQYRSTLDFSNDALGAAKKGFNKLMNALRALEGFEYIHNGEETNEKQEKVIDSAVNGCLRAMNDDMNTAVVISHLFKLTKIINQINMNTLPIGALSAEKFELMKTTFITFTKDILGLKDEMPTDLLPSIYNALERYKTAKEVKDYDSVDAIRAELKEISIVVKDMKHKIDWAYEE